MPYIGKSTDGLGIRERFTYVASANATSISGADANGKTLLFEEQDVRPISISEKVIEDSEGLEESIQRQSKLLDIQEGELFYKLLLKQLKL